jgi:hypothetical protein
MPIPTNPFTLKTMQAHTTVDGTAVMLHLTGSGYDHAYAMPREALASFIGELIKLDEWATINQGLSKFAPSKPEPHQAPEKLYHVRDIDLVSTERGTIILRIYPVEKEPPLDIVFLRDHLKFALAASLETDTPPDDHGAH